MARLFGREVSRSELAARTGAIEQVAGARLMRLEEGKESGVRVVDVRTGSGLRFQVTLDRGMDISSAEYRGVPLAWRSPCGDVHPSYYEPTGTGWIRSFPGGLLTGCGLTQAGASCTDEGVPLGLHGRLSHLPAEHVETWTEWSGDECVVSLRGQVRESVIFGENLLLTRTVRVGLGQSVIRIEDTVRNEASGPSPLMMLYHINPGWPLVDKGSRLYLHTRSTTPRDADAEKGTRDAQTFSEPQPGYREQVFFHDLIADSTGFAAAALVNPDLMLGIFIRYNCGELPRFTEWKMMGAGTYVVGMEPGNCGVLGRAAERAAGTLQILPAGEEQQFHLDLGVLDGEDEIRGFLDAQNLH